MSKSKPKMNVVKETSSSDPTIDSVIQIIKYSNGALGIKTEGSVPVMTHEAIGYLEMAKFDLMARMGQGKFQKEDVELVEINVTQMDLDMDKTGWLKSQGVKVGDPVKIPKALLAMRDDYLKNI